MATELKRIRYGIPFEANGKKYRFDEGFTPERMMWLELYHTEFAGRNGVQGLYDGLTEVYKDLNKAEFIKSAIKVSDLLQGISELNQQKHHPALKICALFINREGEDLSNISEDLINDKINDWNIEGIDSNCFLAFALASIPNYKEIYKLNFPDSSVENKSPKES